MRRTTIVFSGILTWCLWIPAASAAVTRSLPAGLEVVTVDPMVVQALSAAAIGDTVAAPSWPVAPGRRADVAVTRRDVYSADAKIVAIEKGREIEVPRSRLVFFWGAAPADPETRVLLVYDPMIGNLEGTSWSGGKIYRLRREPNGGGEQFRLTASEEDSSPLPPSWTCDGEESEVRSTEIQPERRLEVNAPLLSGSYTAVIAFDTDNEFMASRGNNTTTVANYIATLVATMNTQTYQPDFTSLNLVQGYTVLRPSTIPDPWTATGSPNANPAELSEFSSYWSANYGFITRALALMLSGKQSSGYAASGIAWQTHTGFLCSTSHGYSFNQVFTAGDFFATIGKLVAHEVGHNLGAVHTHCESPPLDMCWNGEAALGCYSGAESCPAGGSGTLMSYCHLLAGCSSTPTFHSYQQAYVNTNIAAAISSCVFPLVTGAASPTSFSPALGPASGGTTVTITGTNIAAGATVTIGSAATVTGTTPTSISAVSAPGTPGKVNVTVTNPSTAGATLGTKFFYYFNDVPPSYGFYNFVNKLLFDGVTAGCGGGNYCPGSSVTRGQMSVFLLRSNGYPAAYTPPACTTATFADVPCSAPFAAWIYDLAARAVTAGCGGGNYCPDSPVTRQQMAVFLLRTKLGSGYTPPAAVGIFSDVPVSSGFASWVEDLYNRGITAGCGTAPLRYCPTDPVTRGQMAVFLVATFSLP